MTAEHIIDKCEGCKWVDNNYCQKYLYPHAQWRAGNCPLATHVTRKPKVDMTKIRPGQQKAKKKKHKDKQQ